MMSPAVDNFSILVTGAAGFIGSHLIRTLQRNGRCTIYALDQEPLPSEFTAPHIVRIQHRLGHDPLESLEQQVGPLDYIVHLAALKHRQSNDEAHYVRSNINGTLEVVALAKKRQVKKVVFSSSLYAHGGMHAPALREDSHPHPTTMYGVSKLCGEGIMDYANAALGVSTVSLRYFFVYGPGQYAGSGYKSLLIGTIERILNGQPPLIYGDGMQSLDYVYIDDVIDATLTALSAPARGTVVNVGSGKAYAVNELVGVIASIMDCGSKPLSGEADWTHGSERCADIERARDVLGWSPATAIEAGLRNTINWIKENRE